LVGITYPFDRRCDFAAVILPLRFAITL
jgi:hypothetical protein